MSRATVSLAAFAVAAPIFVASGTAAAGTEGEPEDCGQPPAMPALSFAEPKVIDPVRAGGEPSVEGLPDGTLVYAAHASTTLFNRDNMPDSDYATPYTGATYLWRSTDGGDSWNYVGLGGTETGPHATVSGFSDPDFAVDLAGNVYTSGINLANVYVAKSSDSGATWTGHPLATVLTDREWLAADEEDVVYLNGNQTGTGRKLWRSTDGGTTFDLTKPIDLPGSGPPSKIYVDQADGRLFFPDGQGRVAVYPFARDGDFSRIDADIDGGIPHAHGFLNDMTVDDGLNVYLVSNTRNQILVSHSTDGGLGWETTVIHDTTADDTPDVAEEVLWPWISSGADGRVGVSWFQADRPVADTEATSASYRVYAAQTATGHGWVDECDEKQDPVYDVAVATPEPFHTGTICASGTTCQAEVPEAVDRRLGDYHTNAITADGSLVIAYSDTSLKPNGAISHPGFVKQSGGVDFVGEQVEAADTVTPPDEAHGPAPAVEEPAVELPEVEAPVKVKPAVEAELPTDPVELLPDPGELLAADEAAGSRKVESASEPATEPTAGEMNGLDDDEYVLADEYASSYAPDVAAVEPASRTSVTSDSAVVDPLRRTSSELGREAFVPLLTWSGMFTALGIAFLFLVAFRSRRGRGCS